MKSKYSFFMVFLLLFSVSCDKNEADTKLMYMPDMVDSTKYKSQLEYLMPPEGSIAKNKVLYLPEDQLEQWENIYRNPFQLHPDRDKIFTEGKILYTNHCGVCHGVSGKGDGNVTSEKFSIRFPPPPDLLSELNKNRKDGFFFHKITVGGPIMPPRSEAVSPIDRWKIVTYIRKLQGIL